MTPNTTMVLSVAMATAPGRRLPSSRDERLPSNSGGVVGATPLDYSPLLRSSPSGVCLRLLEERDVLAAHDPRVVNGLKRPICLDCGDGLIDARSERAVLLQDCAHLVGLQRRAELPDDLTCRVPGKLSVAHVERGAEVDDDAVNLPVLQRRQCGGVVRVDGRIGTWLNHLVDQVEARGVRCSTQLVRLEVVDVLGAGDWVVGECQERLNRIEVRIAEVYVQGALRSDRDLGHVE